MLCLIVVHLKFRSKVRCAEFAIAAVVIMHLYVFGAAKQYLLAFASMQIVGRNRTQKH